MVHTNNTSLYIGSINKRLNWGFNLAQDPIAVLLQLDDASVAIIAPATPLVTVTQPFTSRVNVTWVSGHVTLIIFNVTTADERVFRCQLTAVSGNAWKRNIKVAVVGNYKVIVLYCSLSNTAHFIIVEVQFCPWLKFYFPLFWGIR